MIDPITASQAIRSNPAIVDNDIVQGLVNEHLCDACWREVFLIVAGLKKADSLLQMMERKVQSLMETPNLQRLLGWVQQVTSPISGKIKPVEKRTISLALPLSYVSAYARADAYADYYPTAQANADAITNAQTLLQKTYTNLQTFFEKNCYEAFNNANFEAYVGNFKQFSSWNRNYSSSTHIQALDEIIGYVQWSKKEEIYQGLNFDGIVTQVEQLKTEIPDSITPYNDKTLSGKIVDVCWEGFHLTPEMLNFSDSEIKVLEDYCYGNKLIVDCRKVAVQVNPKIWEEIEARMLLPKN